MRRISQYSHWTRRTALAAGASGLMIAACQSLEPAARADVIVSPTPRAGGVATIAEALGRAARAGGAPFTIRLAPGLYREKLTIGVANVTILGAGADTIIAYDAAAGHARPEGGRWGTRGSATLAIEAPGISLKNLTIVNQFDYLADRITGASGGAQAVALAVGRQADRTLIDRCTIDGYQDTLLLETRTLLRSTRISGCVDFIFGAANAYLDRCEIVCRAVPGSTGGFIAAPSTPERQRFGLVFSRCRLVREAGVPDGSMCLGRPWRAGGNMQLLGAAAFLHCWMDAHISPEGWTSMGYRGADGASRQLTPEEARLFEFESAGPGAGAASARRRMLSPEEARAMTQDAVLDGWRP